MKVPKLLGCWPLGSEAAGVWRLPGPSAKTRPANRRSQHMANNTREDIPPGGRTQLLQRRFDGRGGGGGDTKRELHSLMNDCTAMRDEARALEV